MEGGRRAISGELALAAVLLLGALSVKTIFREGVLPGWDNPPHLVCSYLTAVYFLPQLTVLGWDPYNNFGWVFNQYYNPGAYLLVALIYHAALGFIDINMAYKVAFLITYLLPAVGAYLYVKASTRDPVAACLAALLCIVVMPQESEWLDAGLKQMYVIGMWPHRLGIGVALISLAAYWLALSARGWRWARLASLTAFLIAATLLSHPMTGIGLSAVLLLLTVYAALRAIVIAEGKGLRAKLASSWRGVAWAAATLGVAAAGAGGLAAFWLIPLLKTNYAYHSLPTIKWVLGPGGFNTFLRSLGLLQGALFLMSVLIAASMPSRGSRLIPLTAASAAVIMWLVSAASPYDGCMGLRLIYSSLLFLLASAFSAQPAPLLIGSAASLLLFMATGPASYRFQFLGWTVNMGQLMPFSSDYAYYKFAGLARYLVFAAAAIGFSTPLRRAYESLKEARGAVAQVGWAAIGLIAMLFAALYIIPHLQETDLYYPYAGELHFKLDTDFPMTESLRRIMEWVAANASDNTYVFYQDTLWKLGDWRRLPVSHYFYLSSMLTGKPQVGGGYGTRYITHPLANTEADYLLGQPISWLARHPERLYHVARELGITYFVLFDKTLVNAMRARPDLFEELFVEPPFHVFRTTSFNPIVSIKGGVVEDVEIRPGEIVVKYSAPNDTVVYVRQVEYPGWHARVDGREVEVGRYYPNVPSFVLVPDDGTLTNYKIPFIKVEVPGGEHVLRLYYRLSTPGDAITLVSAITLAALVVLSYLTQRVIRGAKLLRSGHEARGRRPSSGAALPG